MYTPMLRIAYFKMLICFIKNTQFLGENIFYVSYKFACFFLQVHSGVDRCGGDGRARHAVRRGAVPAGVPPAPRHVPHPHGGVCPHAARRLPPGRVECRPSPVPGGPHVGAQE